MTSLITLAEAAKRAKGTTDLQRKKVHATCPDIPLLECKYTSDKKHRNQTKTHVHSCPFYVKLVERLHSSQPRCNLCKTSWSYRGAT